MICPNESTCEIGHGIIIILLSTSTAFFSAQLISSALPAVSLALRLTKLLVTGLSPPEIQAGGVRLGVRGPIITAFTVSTHFEPRSAALTRRLSHDVNASFPLRQFLGLVITALELPRTSGGTSALYCESLFPHLASVDSSQSSRASPNSPEEPTEATFCGLCGFWISNVEVVIPSPDHLTSPRRSSLSPNEPSCLLSKISKPSLPFRPIHQDLIRYSSYPLPARDRLCHVELRIASVTPDAFQRGGLERLSRKAPCIRLLVMR